MQGWQTQYLVHCSAEGAWWTANFVATNTESILQAYTTVTEGGVALPFDIYDEENLIGFVMLGYGRQEVVIRQSRRILIPFGGLWLIKPGREKD